MRRDQLVRLRPFLNHPGIDKGGKEVMIPVTSRAAVGRTLNPSTLTP